MTQEKLAAAAEIAAAMVLVAWLTVQTRMKLSLALPSMAREGMRRMVLKMRRMEEYSGRHRAVLA